MMMFDVALTKCFFCGKGNEILINTRPTIKYSVKNYDGKVISTRPCSECEEKMKKFVWFIEYDEDKTINGEPPYRTGFQFGIKRELIDGADFVCVRELTGGLYFGKPQGRSEDGKTAYDTCVYSVYEIERILKLGFEMAGQRRKKLTVVDKANVLATSRLWRETAQAMAPSYPDIELEYMFVDNAAMQIIQWPKYFDVIVTENLFGDILSDESSVISGSLGVLPSASVGLKTSLFEPIHGSYPQAAGKNIAGL